MSGREVAARARQLNPSIKVLLTSGYTDEVAHRNDLEREQLKLLRKPYHQSDLVAALREVLAPCGRATKSGRAIVAHACLSSLTCIKLITRFLCMNCEPYRRAGIPLTEQSQLRFAVGIFDNWSQVREALRDTRARGLVVEG